MGFQRMLLLAAALIMLGAAPARAQQGPQPFRLQEINFDVWCQETQHLPPARCDKRLPEDDTAFQAYSNMIQNYEIQYLNRQAEDRRIQRMLKNNPADRPTVPPPGN